MNQFIGKQFDQYQIGPLLGEGGMGAVYHAHDLKNNRAVALKIMLANLTSKPHFRQRFQQEAEMCAAFNSPAIVKIYGNGTVDGYPYIAMEYVEGGSLSHYVNQIGWGGNKLPLDELLALSAQIAEGLAYAHQRGLVHRDIKPDNILLKLRDGATGTPHQAVLSDFGLAVQLKTVDDMATNPFMGSLAYMSPEQCENSGLDGRSDIYALGIILYELTTGQLPFQINAPADIVKHIQEAPLPPRLINPDLPQPVEDIILKAIAKKPNERYQTAAEMAHALRQIASDDSLLTAVPLESQNAVTQWLENKWIAAVNVQDRVDTNKTWTSDGRYRLFITSQHEESEIHGLNKPIITVGRSADNDIVLEDRTISAHHTSLTMNDNGDAGSGGWSARDLGSTNGSYLGDRPLAFNEDVHWNNEEALQIGPYYLKWQLFSGDNGAVAPLAGAALLGAAAMGTAAVGAAVIANGSDKNETPVVDFDGGTAVSSSDNLSIAITPETAVLEPDNELPIDITISNTGITVQEVSIRLFDSGGRQPLWIRLDENRLKLMPEESASLTAIANLPADYHMDAGEHILNVQATSDRGESETAVITLARPDSESFTLDMHPSNLQEDVVCRLTIRDASNFANAYTIMGIDDADALLFDFQEPQNGILSDFDTNQQTIKVAAQSEANTSFTIRPKKRPLFGNDKPTPYKIRVRTEMTDWQTLTGQVDIHSRISRRLIIFLLLLLMLLCLLGFGVYSMVAADKEGQRLENQTQLDSIGATATAAQAGANQIILDAENAQATANALAASGDMEAAANAQATADALQFEANSAQAEVNAMQGEIDSLAAAIDVTATPPPPPSNITLDVDNVDEDAPIGSTVGSFVASTAALFNPDGSNLTGLYASNTASQNSSTKPVRSLFRRSSQSSIAYTYSIVGGETDAFYIDGAVLKTAVLFDYETQDSYDIVVMADNGLGGTLEAGFSITINDVSDTPVLTFSDVAVDEGDGTAVLTVLMTGSTQSEVSVDYSTSDDTAVAGEDYEEGGDTLTWAAGESGEKEITITLTDDDIQESTETFEVTLEKAVIALIDGETAVVTISDDESTPTISIVDAAAAEGDGEAVVIVSMTGKSSEDVTVSYATKDGTASEDSDYSADDGELVWAAGEDGDKEITISFEDDEMDESDETLTITLSDATNGVIDSGTATVTIEDDDDPPTLAIQAAGPFAESADSATLTILIEGSSSEEVEVSFATSDDTATAGKDYTNTSGTITWAAESTSAQSIVVPILSDTVYEGEDETFIVTLSAPVNATIATAEESYAITDDDDQPTLSISSVTVDETDSSAVVTVAMTGGSSTEVTVEYTTADETAVAGDDYGQTASPPVLTWAADEQDSTRDISIVIHDDNFDEGTSETFLVNLLNNSSNSILSSSSATVTINDDDTAGISLDTTSATISEPDVTDSFIIRLDSEPLGTVTIPLELADPVIPAQCTIPASVDIPPSSWSSGVSVTITPEDDFIDEDQINCDIITGDPTSTDSQYEALADTDVADVTVILNDDDTADITVAPLNLQISETVSLSTDIFTIQLATQPTDDVTIPVTSLDTDQCTINRTSVILTSLTWNTGEDVLVTGTPEDVVDDDDNICNISTGNPTSNDSKYAIFSGDQVDDVTVTVINDDAPGATVSPTNLIISETTATAGVPFTITLNSNPTSSVSFNLSVDNDCLLSDASNTNVSSMTVEIFPLDWDQGVSVDVTSTNDAIDDGDSTCLVTIDAASSSDPDYHGVIDPTDVTVTVLDDDTTAVLITQSGGTTEVTEGGATPDDYTVVLQSEPTNDVTVTLSPDGEIGLDAGAAGVNVDLLFTATGANAWNVVRTVTVTANDDDIDENGTHNGIITHTVSSSDPLYNVDTAIEIDGVVETDITAVITDNDTAGITIDHTSTDPNVTEAGSSDSYSIVLDSQPWTSVIITIDPDGELDVGNGAGNAISITIAPANWDSLNTVTITANDDALDEADPHTGVIDHSSSSTDSNYNTGAVITPTSSLSISIADDDTTPVIGAGQTVTISEDASSNTLLSPALTATDADGDSSFTWSIDSAIPANGSSYFDFSGNNLRLTTTGANNLDYESQKTYTMTLTTSDGTNTSATVPVYITVVDVDDEAPTVITNTGITVNEGATVTLSLSELGADDVDSSVDALVFSVTGGGPFRGYLQFNTNPGVAISSFTHLELENGNVAYVHDGTDTTTDQFAFTVTDSNSNSSTSENFDITITAVDDTAPTVSVNNGLTANEGMTTTISISELDATDTETADNTIIFTTTTAVTNGYIQLSGAVGVAVTSFSRGDLVTNQVQYVHDGSETTSDNFVFTIADSNGNTLTGQAFTITVTPVNDPPVAFNDAENVNEDTNLTVAAPGVLFNDTDVEGDGLTAVIDTNPSNALSFSLSSNGGFSYQATSDYCGSDSFTYHADDGDPSNVATVNLTIDCVNDSPTATDDITSTAGTQNFNIYVLNNDSDTETTSLLYTDITLGTPTTGTVIIHANGNSLRYTPPNPAVNATATFTYTICDDGDDGINGPGTLPIECNGATVTVNLTVASAEPTVFIAQADDCEEMDSCLRRNDNLKPLFVLGKQGNDGEITAVLTHQTLIPGSSTVRLNLYISLQNGDGSPNAEAVLMETAVLLSDGSLYPAELSQEPAYLVLAVDASDSMDGLLDPLREAAIALVNNVPDGSNIAVIRYDENIDLLQSFSNDRAAVGNALNSIQIEADDTCTYDAAYAAMQAVVQTAPNSPNRAIVLVSDGVDRDANGNIADTCSDYTEAQTIAYAAANEIAIHIIGSDGADDLPIAALAQGSGGTMNIITEQSPTLERPLLDSFGSQWIASATMQPSLGLQRGAALLTLADGSTPSPVPVQFVSPRDYVVPETAVIPMNIDISNFRYDDDRDQFQMDVAVSNLSDVELLRVELLDSGTNVQAGLSIITEPQFSQRVAIAADGLTGNESSIAHAYALNASGGILRDANGDPVEAFYTFQHTPAAAPTVLTIQAVTVDDEAAKFDLGGLNLENDPPTMRVQFALENGDEAATINGRLIHLSNNAPSETFTVTAMMIGDVGTATVVRQLDEGEYTLVLNALDENGRSLADDDAQFNYTIPDGRVGRAGKALVNNPLLWLFFLVTLFIVVIVVASGSHQAGKKKGTADNVALNSPIVADVVEEEIVAVQLTVIESPDGEITAVNQWQLADFPFTIGRKGCDLTIANDHHISRKHAQITLVDGDYFIEDLGSANGTFLNGTRLAANEPFSLSAERGERITIGKTTTFSFGESES